MIMKKQEEIIKNKLVFIIKQDSTSHNIKKNLNIFQKPAGKFLFQAAYFHFVARKVRTKNESSGSHCKISHEN